MNNKVLHVLEYTKIIDKLTDKATSEQGKKLTSSLVPMTDLEAINQAQTETANALGYLFRKSREPMGCHLCPVAAASELLPARDAEGNYMLNENNEILSEADVIRMAEDGEK